MKILSHGSQCPGRDSNRALPELKSKLLQSEPTYLVLSDRKISE
jgi:hypothetical protein